MYKSFILAALAAVCQSAAVSQPRSAEQQVRSTESSTSSSSPQQLCKNIIIPVDVSATAKKLASDLTISGLTSSFLNDAVATLPTLISGGKYNIAARYCEPAKKVASRANTLQLLVHGITYTHTYWSGLAGDNATSDAGVGIKYSWLDYASKQGYPTLAVDRLCNGASDHPNGLLDCQVPLQAETMRAVIAAARRGVSGRAFKKVVFVGHSYGSLVAAGMAIQHPADSGADALLLTGFTNQLLYGEAGVTVEPDWVPAAVYDAATYGKDDPSYIIATSEDGAKELFYYGSYDPKVADYDYQHRQTVTLGELATVNFGGQIQGSNYTGPVFVMNGDHDTVFCETSAVSPAVMQVGDCKGLDQNVKTRVFPKASQFKYVDAPNTGHCLNLHETAQNLFKAAHDWLASIGY